MKVKLTVTEGTEKGKVFSFDEPENFLLGRTAEGSKAHLCLSPDDTYVSRNHFLLEINPPDCFIRDAGSLNGTYILRPLEKTVYFLEGRGSEKKTYERMAEEHQKNWGYKTLKKSSDRLPLKHKDVIKIGRTTLLVEIEETKVYDISDYHWPAETICCIECGNKINRKNEAKDVRKLSSDDYVCDACLKRYADIHIPK